MKSKLILPLSFFVCVLFTCCYNEKDLPFEHSELFTLTIPSDFNSDEGDHWIILSNALGEAITWQSFKSGEQVKLSGDVKQGTNVVTVTLLSHNIYYDNYSVESFADIPIGSEWTLPVDNTYGTFPIAGHISFRLIGFPASGPYKFVLSSLDGALGPNFIYGNPGGNFSIPKSPSQIFLHMPHNAGSVPKYMVIDHVTAGDIIDVGFSKLSDYDHMFTVPITLGYGNYMASVRGFHTPIEAHNDSHSHTLTYFDGGDFDPTQFTVTYNDGYSFYKTGWEAANELKVTRYEKIGAPPTPDNFVMPNYNVRIEGKQVNDFRIASESQFAFNSAMWRASGSKLIWWVNRPEAAQHPILIKFPDELTSRQKLLAAYANDLKLWQFILYDVRSGLTYENWLRQTYDPTAFQYREREYYSFKVHMY